MTRDSSVVILPRNDRVACRCYPNTGVWGLIVMERSNFIKKAKRIVIKVGTSIITTEAGKIDDGKISQLADQLSEIFKQGYEVLLVSSGAIAAGVEALGFSLIPKAIPELQACASVGQGLLVHKYQEVFKQKGITVGQVLLTQHDTTHRQQYVNAKNTLHKLLDMKAVPIINENDSTAVDEIKFGDNDTLAALVANISEADLLVILSDVDGLFSGDPKTEEAELISEVKDISAEIEQAAGGSGTLFGKGGMETKVRAAKMATAGQTGVVIANGHDETILSKIVKAEQVGTFFVPTRNKISARKLWILNQPPKGKIVIDEGAGKAIKTGGKSLLSAGIAGVVSDFDIGEVVSIHVKNDGNRQIAKGITNYSSAELNLIAGKKYSEVVELMNGDASEEVIHRDDLVIVNR